MPKKQSKFNRGELWPRRPEGSSKATRHALFQQFSEEVQALKKADRKMLYRQSIRWLRYRPVVSRLAIVKKIESLQLPVMVMASLLDYIERMDWPKHGTCTVCNREIPNDGFWHTFCGGIECTKDAIKEAGEFDHFLES